MLLYDYTCGGLGWSQGGGARQARSLPDQPCADSATGICQPYRSSSAVLPPLLTALVTRVMRYRGRFKLNRSSD